MIFLILVGIFCRDFCESFNCFRTEVMSMSANNASNWTFAKMLKQAQTTTVAVSEAALRASSVTLRRKGVAAEH